MLHFIPVQYTYSLKMEILDISLTSFAVFSDIAFNTETIKGVIFVIRHTGGFFLTWRGRARGLERGNV